MATERGDITWATQNSRCSDRCNLKRCVAVLTAGQPGPEAHTMAAMTAHPSLAPSRAAPDLASHTEPAATFDFTPFLRATHQHALAADSAPGGQPAHTHAGRGPSLVCKHWLRGLCKKGAHCEFLHEYNLRKMPECNFFTRNGYCSNGEECLYLHIDPQSKLPPCPHYDMGFCPLGPACAKKHVRRALCLFYLAGFCPAGRDCRDGAHPRWKKDLERPKLKVEVQREEEELKRQEELERQAAGLHEPQRDMRDDRGGFGDRGDRRHGHGGRGGGGAGGGKWRDRGGGGGGGRRFRGRGH
ncbi:hypothetical protein BN1723_005753 [Verticillium longisporum]|uniref:mRNA 3'-end-processing protein n=3 Tax=Verticillium longisporum TaxID=100787 RepID=A0A0G4NAK0_VERLO|nr:hypothetical protein BN1723_005753 [Verticillium longisporum]